MRWIGDLEVGDESLWRKMKRRMKTTRNEQFIVTFLAEKRCHNLGLRLFSFSMFCVFFLEKIYAQEGLEVLGLIWFWLVSNVSYTEQKKKYCADHHYLCWDN